MVRQSVSQRIPAERSEIPLGTLRAQMAPGMSMEPLSTTPTCKGNIYDFHQNTAGWIAFTPTGNPGDTIRVKYAEKLNADGTLYLENFRDAESEDIYVCGQSSNSQLEWHPIFSYHGFRYAKITGPVKDVHAYLGGASIPIIKECPLIVHSAMNDSPG